MTQAELLKKCEQQIQYIFPAKYDSSMSYADHLNYAIDSKTVFCLFTKAILAKYPNFKFQHFYDKQFLKLAREYIKNRQLFTEFISSNNIDIQYFIKLMIKIMPDVFSSHLVKFFKENYLTKHELHRTDNRRNI